MNVTSSLGVAYVNREKKFNPFKNEFPTYFLNSNYKVLKSDYTNDVLWGRIQFKNTSKKNISKVLFLNSFTTGFITFYYKNDQYKTGSGIPIDQRSDKSVLPSVEIELGPGEYQSLYFKQYGHNKFTSKFFVTDKHEFELYKVNKMNSYRYYVGAIGVLIIYNLMLSIFFKSKKYIWFCLFMSSVLIAVINLNGLLDYYSWFDKTTFTNNLTLTSSLAVSMALLFGFSFLDGDKLLKSLAPVKKILLVASLLPLGLIIVPAYHPLKHYFSNYIDIMIMLDLFFLMICSYYAMRKGADLAKFYLLSWFFVFLGACLYFFDAYGLIGRNFFTENGFLFGSLFEMIILSIALSYQAVIIDKRIVEKKIRSEGEAKYEELLRTISHDISNSLQVIVVGTRRLKKIVHDEKAYDVTEKMEVSATNIVDILKQIKERKKTIISKKIKLEKVSLNTILNELIIIYEDNLIEKNILIKINIPVSHQSIYAESVSLKNNVLGNILSNSIKFTPANGTISISSKKEGKYITLIIKDSGKGFDQSSLEFFNEAELTQMDQVKLSKDVGLKIIKNYIEMNQAKIKVYNNSGAVYEISFLAEF